MVKKRVNITDLYYKNISTYHIPEYLLFGGGNELPEDITEEYYKKLENLQPKKRLGKGSQGVVVSTQNNDYVVKIFYSNAKGLKFFVAIHNHLFNNNSDLIPTVYHSFYIDTKINSLNRYINDAKLPNHFSYETNNELQRLKNNGFNMRYRLFEVMQQYDYTLQNFIPILFTNYNSDEQYNILKSFFYQGLITIVWLFINKGVVHSDILLDNFLIKKTEKKSIKIKIFNTVLEIKLFGYYFVLSDFANARSIELFDYDSFPNTKPSNGLLYSPLEDIDYYLQMFKKNFGVTLTILHNIKYPRYDLVIREYIRDKRHHYFQEKLNDFKKHFFRYVFFSLLDGQKRLAFPQK